MNYTIKNSMKTGEYEGKYGKLYKYTIQLEGENDAVELSQKPDSPEPKAGDVLEGTIEDTQYGKKFKKEKSFTGNTYIRPDGETQNFIIRQNSLTNAVNYCVAKAQLDKDYKLTGKEVVQVATYFAKYSKGEVTVVTESKKEPVAEEPEIDPNDPMFN